MNLNLIYGGFLASFYNELSCNLSDLGSDGLSTMTKQINIKYLNPAYTNTDYMAVAEINKLENENIFINI